MGRIKLSPHVDVSAGFKANTFGRMRQDGEIRELERVDEFVFKGLSREFFEQRSVHENRHLAQRIGVESATTLSKTMLVDKLIDKVWGLQSFSHGYKKVGEVDINKISAELELDILEDIKNGEVIIGEEREGIFFKTDVGGVLYDVGTNSNDLIIDTCVLRNLVGEFTLTDGDYVKGRVKYYPKAEFYCLIRIDEINGRFIRGQERPLMDAKPCKPNEKVTFSGKGKIVNGLSLAAPVCYGQLGVVATNGKMDFTATAEEIYGAVQGCEKMLFVLGEREITVERIRKQYPENGVYCSEIGCKSKTGMLKKMLEFASRQARDGGKRLVIVINDIDMLDKSQDNGGVDAMLLASYAGAYDNGGSVTIIGITTTLSPLSGYYVIRNLLDFELSLKAGADVMQNVTDILGSYSVSKREGNATEELAIARLRHMALTEGAAAVDRILSDNVSAEEIIKNIAG